MIADRKCPRRCAAFLLAVILAGAAGAPHVRGEEPGTAVPAAATGPEKPAAQQPPVTIRAEQAEYFNVENRVVFSGKVVAVQGDATLTAERMEVTFAPPPEREGGKAQPLTEPQTGIRTITATQNVSFRQVDPETKKERYGVGERGDYDAEARVMTLTGNPRVWEGKNVMTGDKMIFFLDNHRFQAQGKVNLTVYPAETKAGEKSAPEAPGQDRVREKEKAP